MNFNGSLEGLVYGIDVRSLPGAGFDFGTLNQVAASIIDFIVLTQDIDFGTVTAPEEVSVDFGSF